MAPRPLNNDKILIDKVSYYLALTRVRIHGTRTERTPLGGELGITSELNIDLVTSADPSHPRYIVDADSLLADRQLIVEWSENGLLASTNASSTGKLGEIIKNIFGAVLRLGFFGTGSIRLRTPDTGPKPRAEEDPVEAAYKGKFPDLSAARLAAKQAVSALLQAIATGSEALGRENETANVKDKRERLKELTSALTDLKKEAEALENHFNSWKAGAEKITVTRRDYTAGLEELPGEDDILLLQGKTEQELKQALRTHMKTTLRDVFWDLGVIVADEKKLPDPVSKLPKDPDKSPVGNRVNSRGIEFRLPRPALLSLFEIRPDANNPSRRGSRIRSSVPANATFSTVLKERRAVSVSDDSCITAMLRFKEGIFSSKSLDIDFTANGAPKKVTSNAKAELAAFADVLSKLPAEALQSLKDANSFIDERQKLALQGIEQRIDELKKSKEEVTSRIALNETLATEEQAAELKRLDQEISLLQKQVQLKELTGTEASDVQLKLVQIEEGMIKARTALERAEIERLKVQAELKKTQNSAPKPDADGV